MKVNYYCPNTIHAKALANSAKTLAPDQAVEFLTEPKSVQKQWNIHKKAKSDLIAPLCKGHAVPERKSGLKPKDAAFGATFSRANQGMPQISQIYGLRDCRTETDKARLIAKSDASPEVKADLIEFHCKGLLKG